MQPFTIAVPQDRLDRIRGRVADYEWHEMPAAGGWGYGANLDYMRALCGYWLDHYDWRAAETRLNRFPQFIATVDGLDLHFYHVRSPHPGAMPLILTHGWPGSVLEFLDLIEPLTDPARFGGDPADAFDVVVPSLPGYGWSGKPADPIGPRTVARLFDGLMTGVLGHDRYLAQGGDWGAAVSAWLGFDHPDHVVGVHLNMVGTRSTASRPQTDEEKLWDRERRRRFEDGGAYFRQQWTRPQTLSYAMMDSPVGTAAWIVEKFHAWGDITGGDVESRFSKDTLLTNVMIYLVTRSFNTASWLYRGVFDDGPAAFPDDRRVEVPVAVAAFPGDDLYQTPPRSYVEKGYNVVRWTEMPAGGHFAALEEPQLLIDDVRGFARSLR